MIIEEKDFKLEFSGGERFDLYFLVCVNKGKINERFEFRREGYGYLIDQALTKIAMRRVANKHQEGTITFETFVNSYVKASKELELLIPKARQIIDMLANNDKSPKITE